MCSVVNCDPDWSTDEIAATPPFRSSQVAAAYLRAAHNHYEHIKQCLVSLHFQHEAVRIAAGSLDLNVLAIVDIFEGIATGSRRELEKQASLLSGLEADLKLIGRVRIHVEFMSSAVRKAIEAGERQRTLGDYVSNVKMKQVAETCARTHGASGNVGTYIVELTLSQEDLQTRFKQAEVAVQRLKEGTDIVRSAVSSTKSVIISQAEEMVTQMALGSWRMLNCVREEQRISLTE